MALYFVEGTIKIKIDIEIEADSLEEAEIKALAEFKADHPFHPYADIDEDNIDLSGGHFDNEEYDD